MRRDARERRPTAQDSGPPNTGGAGRGADRRDRRAEHPGEPLHPRRLVRRGASGTGARPTALGPERGLPARLSRTRRGRPHRLDRGRRAEGRDPNDRGRGRHADRDPERAQPGAPRDRRLRPRRARARQRDRAHRRRGHRARLLPRPMGGRGSPRAHPQPAGAARRGADPGTRPGSLPGPGVQHVREWRLSSGKERSTGQRLACHPLPAPTHCLDLRADDRTSSQSRQCLHFAPPGGRRGGKRTVIITVRSSGRAVWGKRTVIITVRSSGRPAWGKRVVCPAGGGDGHSAAILAIHSRNRRSTAGPFSEPNASASSGPSSSPRPCRTRSRSSIPISSPTDCRR